MSIPQPHLLIENLSIDLKKIHQSQHIVKNISFHVNKGETFALVGESGSGKTMTALAVNGILPFSMRYGENSRITFQGTSILDLSEQQMQKIRGKKIAMVFQEPMTALNPVMTIGKQISEVFKQHNVVAKHQCRQETITLLEQVGIPDPKRCYQQYPHQLSGGMKQRAMIAMSLAAKPELLIADEPTTALDVTIQMQILQLLKSLQAQYSMSILLITHNFAIVSQIAERIAVMHQGEIVECAPTEQFFQSAQHPYSQKLLQASLQFDGHQRHQSENILHDHPLLKVKDLKIYFPVTKGLLKRKIADFKAVDQVSLELFEGKTLALVGESGCGKTTLGRGIIKLLPITEGEVLYSNENIKNFTHKQIQNLRQDVQIVFQDPYSSLNPHMLVGDIIVEGVIAHKPRMTKPQSDALISELLQAVNLPEESRWRYPHEFSGGQRQRIGIARALALQPKIIICDEPTSALDVSVQAQILKLLKDLQQQRGLSYLFISHDIAVVSFMADEVAVMYLGRIVEQGPADQVLYSPKHPYTQALVASVPTMKKQPLISVVKGEQPSPMNQPQGCHFCSRCPKVMPICKEQYPRWSKLGDQHKVRCYLYQ